MRGIICKYKMTKQLVKILDDFVCYVNTYNLSTEEKNTFYRILVEYSKNKIEEKFEGEVMESIKCPHCNKIYHNLNDFKGDWNFIERGAAYYLGPVGVDCINCKKEFWVAESADQIYKVAKTEKGVQ